MRLHTYIHIYTYIYIYLCENEASAEARALREEKKTSRCRGGIYTQKVAVCTYGAGTGAEEKKEEEGSPLNAYNVEAILRKDSLRLRKRKCA